MADPYLTTFFADIQKVLQGIFTTIEFLIGFSYFCGKKLTEAILTGSLFVWDALYEVGVWAGYAIEQIIEVEKFIINCVFLLYFGVCQICEAFCITYYDLKSFLIHFAESLSQHCYNSVDAIVTSVHSLAIIPEQLWAALSIVGDFAFTSLLSLRLLAKDFLTQLILAPVNVLVVTGKVLMSVLNLPVVIFKDVTLSALMGICVLLLLYFICYKETFIFVVKLPWTVMKIIWNSFTNFSDSPLYSLVFRLKSRYDDEMSSGKPIKGICVVCQVNPVVYIAKPCHHVCLCRDCVRELTGFDNRCPMCRRDVETYERVYIS